VEETVEKGKRAFKKGKKEIFWEVPKGPEGGKGPLSYNGYGPSIK